MTGSSSKAVTAPNEARIIKQIEYYFGDFNLVRDKFLQEKMQEDDGWVTMDTMLTFNRLKEITDDAQMICEALKKSSSGLMEVSEQGDKIRRSPSKPLPTDNKERRKEIIARTVFAKPFPLDVKLDDLLEFFESYGQLDKVFMKRHFQKKTFKGFVFVTFANKEDAVKFVNEEKTKFNEQALEDKCFKTDYFKRDEIIARTVFAKPFPLDVKLNDLLEFFESYGQLENVFMNRHFQNKTFKGSVFATFDNKEDAVKFVSEEETKFKEQALEVKCFKIDCFRFKAAQTKATFKKDTKGKLHKKGEYETKEDEAEADLEERVSREMTKNAVLHLKGLNSKTSREQVKAFFSKHAFVGWVDFDYGATEGYIRLREPDSAVSTLEKAKSVNDGKIVINDSEIEVTVVEGAEELQYWKKMLKDIGDKKKSRERRRRKSDRNQRGERRNRGGPQSKMKDNTTDDSEGKGNDLEEQDTDEQPAKVVKSELVIKFQEMLKFKDASCGGEEQHTEETPAKVNISENITGPQGKRKQYKMDSSSDLEEQDTEKPPAKVIKSEMIIKFEEVLKFKDASCGREEQVTEEPKVKVITSEVVFNFEEVMKFEDASIDVNVEEQDTEVPPAMVIESEMIITRSQGKRKQNKNHALSDGDKQDTEGPPAKVSKSEMIITPKGKRKQNTMHDSSDGEEHDTEEPPVKVIKSDMIIRRSRCKRKPNKMHSSSDGEEQNTEKPAAKVIKSEVITTTLQSKRKHNKKHASSDGEEEDLVEPPAKVIKSHTIIRRSHGKTKQKKRDASSYSEEPDTE